MNTLPIEADDAFISSISPMMTSPPPPNDFSSTSPVTMTLPPPPDELGSMSSMAAHDAAAKIRSKMKLEVRVQRRILSDAVKEVRGRSILEEEIRSWGSSSILEEIIEEVRRRSSSSSLKEITDEIRYEVCKLILREEKEETRGGISISLKKIIDEVRRRSSGSCYEEMIEIMEIMEEILEEVRSRIFHEEEEKRSRRSSLSLEERLQGPVSHKLRQNARLAKVDPCYLPAQHFATVKEPSMKTRSGFWKEKEDAFTAIRSQGQDSSTSRSPSYHGVKRTFEFYLRNGTKTDWVMHEHQLLDADMRKPDLFLHEDVVIRKVFQTRTNHPQVKSRYAKGHTSAGDRMSREELVLLLKYVFRKRRESYENELGRLSEEEDLGAAGCSEARSGCGESRAASAAPNGKSDVWQHFTKIHTKDPDVVYAACHRCDSVLKAASKNGTSSLRRHIQNCSCNKNPSTATDQDMEILRELRAAIDLYKEDKMATGVDSLDLNTGISKMDPWDLQPSPGYITSSLSRKTQQGSWEQIKHKKLAAIRIDQLPVPQYVGLKRTLEFHQGGTKTIMIEYLQVDVYKAADLLLEGALLFRKVLQDGKDAAVSYDLRELDRMLNEDDCEDFDGEQQELKTYMSMLISDCLPGEGAQGDQSRLGKRKRTSAPDGKSEVWLHFTKIYTADPDRVYAVCHCCDRGYNGHSKNGTSHLRRHNENCSSKHHEREVEVWPFALIFEI